jgi:hypothetical protein
LGSLAAAQAPRTLSGKWEGTLDVGAAKLRLALDVATGADGKPAGTLTSLDQGNAVIPITAFTVEGDAVRFDLAAISGRYDGIFADDATLTGTWTQGMSWPLEFKRVTNQ